MKRLVKKAAVILSSVILISTLFVNGTYASSKVDVSRPVELTWYFIGPGEQQDTAKVEKKIYEYLKSKYKMNTKVKLKCIEWGSYSEKMQEIISEYKPFDICFTNTWANNYFEQAERGAFVPLDNLWDLYAPRTKALLNSAALESSKVDGVSYSIPTYERTAWQWGFLISKGLRKEYHINLAGIEKIADIEPILQEIKTNLPNAYPLSIQAGNYEYFKSVQYDVIDNRYGYTDYPGVLLSSGKEKKIINELETPETYEFFKTLHKFYELGYVTGESNNAIVKFKRIAPDDDGGSDYIAVPLKPAVLSNAYALGSMQAISRASKNPERAMMFLELVNTDPYLNNLINFGIEGVHYKKISKNMIEETAQTFKYNPGSGWVYGNHYLNYVYKGEDPKVWEKCKQFDQKARKPKAYGFVFNSEPVKDEVENCRKIWYDYIPGLETGQMDPDVYLKEMIESLKKAGVEKVIAEEQRQLDEWIASK